MVKEIIRKYGVNNRRRYAMFRKPAINFNLKLLIITDTHNSLMKKHFENIDYQNIDCCLLLGDISYDDLTIIKQLISKPIYGVLGNHDCWSLYEDNQIEDIHGKVIEINGVKIAGLQGSLKYKDVNAPLYTDKESKRIAREIPKADILISHDSPKYLYGKDNYAHSGLQGITDYLVKNKVPLNIHGHHHKSSVERLRNGTVCKGCYGIEIIETNKLI